jgi:hypothetical protein
MSDSLIKQRADAQFRKLPGAEGGKTAMSEHAAAAAAVTTNTVRLKGLRLARDAAEHAAPPAAVPVKKVGRKKKRPAVSLSDWLKNRHAGGHAN